MVKKFSNLSKPLGYKAHPKQKSRGLLMPNKFKLLLAVLFSFLNTVALAEKLVVVADEWPPFSGERLPNKGISPHIIKTVLEKAGYEIDIKILPWARIMHGSKNGEFDIIGSLFYSEELLPYMDYSDSYYDTDIVFVKKKGSNISYKDLDSLRPYKIAVGDGFLYEPEFDQANYLNKVVATTTLQCIQLVAFGRADITLDSIDVLKYTIENDAKEVKSDLEYIPKKLTTQPLYMAVNNQLKNHKKIIDDFAKTLRLMKKDGSYHKLLKAHK